VKFGFKKIGKRGFSTIDADELGDADGVTYAETFDDIKTSEIWILLNTEVIRPLFEVQRLNLADVLGLRCWIAGIIVHEW